MRTASSALSSWRAASCSHGVENDPTRASPRESSSTRSTPGSVGMNPQSPSSVPT